jgi:hypothetical protein
MFIFYTKSIIRKKNTKIVNTWTPREMFHVTSRRRLRNRGPAFPPLKKWCRRREKSWIYEHPQEDNDMHPDF